MTASAMSEPGRLTTARANERAQSFIEYALLLTVIAAALLGMQLYAKRGIQAGIKTATDRMSPFPNDPQGELAQLAGMNQEAGQRQDEALSNFDLGGRLLDRRSGSRALTSQSTSVNVLEGAATETTMAETTTKSGALTDVGPGVSSASVVVLDVRD